MVLCPHLANGGISASWPELGVKAEIPNINEVPRGRVSDSSSWVHVGFLHWLTEPYKGRTTRQTGLDGIEFPTLSNKRSYTQPLTKCSSTEISRAPGDDVLLYQEALSPKRYVCPRDKCVQSLGLDYSRLNCLWRRPAGVSQSLHCLNRLAR